MNKSIVSLCSLTICLGFADTATAEKITSCTFDVEAGPRGVAKSSEPLNFTFRTDDLNKNFSVLGNQGIWDEVIGVANAWGFSFVEITGTGNVAVTTITADGAAVHSRHMILGAADRFIPSQWYGKCVTKNFELGQLTSEMVTAGLASVKSSVEKCGVVASDDSSGSLQVETIAVYFMVAGDGMITSSHVKTDSKTEAVRVLAQCVRGAVLTANFPKTKNGGTFSIGYKFNRPWRFATQ